MSFHKLGNLLILFIILFIVSASRRDNRHFDIGLIFDGLGPYFLCQKMEKTQLMKEEMDIKMFISRQISRFLFIVFTI